MAISSIVKLNIDSRRSGNTYEIARFTEFNIDIDLDADSDLFEFVIKNPRGIYSGLFSKFDNCRIYVNNNIIMEGSIDKVGYVENESDQFITLSGRDKCAVLIDNDSLPDTIENVNPKTYIERICGTYGLKHSISSATTFNKLVISCGESEMSIFHNLLLDDKQRVWYLIDTVYTGSWSVNASPSHIFVKDTTESGIPIKTFNLSEDGAEMKSEVIMYGSNESDQFDIEGKYINNYMKNIGVNKRETKRAYSDSASSRYNANAEKLVRDSFRDNSELVISVRFDQKNYYMPNKTAQIINGNCGVNSLFFIKKVTYEKTIDGSSATLTLIPADSTFEKIWQSSGTSVTNTI